MRSQKGQVIIEYVLLLVVIVGLGAVILRSMVSRDQDSPGFLIQKWKSVSDQIANDQIK